MFLRKQIAVIVAILVLISNSGLAFNIHYCGNKVSGISSVFSKEESCTPSDNQKTKKTAVNNEKKCCSKKETSHKKCCSDKELNLKNKTEKIVIKTISFDFEPAFFNEVTQSEILLLTKEQIIHQTSKYYCDAHAPPLYKLYCQYTFYA